MQTFARLLDILIRIFGGGAVLLGVTFWLGYARSFTAVHMVLGITVVVALWALAALAWSNAGLRRLAIFAVVWGLTTWVLGATQTTILPGTGHWIVQVAHLLLGVGSIVFGRRLARAIGQRSMGSATARTQS